MKAPFEGAFLLAAVSVLNIKEYMQTSGCEQTALSFVWEAILLTQSAF